MASCSLHRTVLTTAPGRAVKVDGKTVQSLLDSGSSVRLVKSTVVRPRQEQKMALPITFFHSDARCIHVHTSAEPRTWSVEVSIVQDLPVLMLLGRDWPGFDQLLTITLQVVATNRERRWRRRQGPPTRQAILLSPDIEREGKSQPAGLPNVLFDVFQQATVGGSFGREQRENERLLPLLGSSLADRRRGMVSSPASPPSLHHQNWPAVLCYPQAGGGKNATGGA